MQNSEFVKTEILHFAYSSFCVKNLALFRCLTEEEVFHDYLAAETWLEYRKKVVQSVIDVKKRISALSKDSSGWMA